MTQVHQMAERVDPNEMVRYVHDLMAHAQSPSGDTSIAVAQRQWRRHTHGSRRTLAVERTQPRLRRCAGEFLDQSATARSDSCTGRAHRRRGRRQADHRRGRSGIRYPDFVGRHVAIVRTRRACLRRQDLRITESDEVAVNQALAAVVAHPMAVHAGDVAAGGFQHRLSSCCIPLRRCAEAYI